MKRTSLHQLHRFLMRHTFYPVLLASILPCVFLAGRIRMTDSHNYLFMVWNLFLAWLPYVFSLMVERLREREPRRWVRLLPFGALWLLFFPNAPYIVTDLVHLWRIPPAIWWYDVGMIAAFAWAGCFLGVASLHVMQGVVRTYLGAGISWLFVLVSLALGGVGVYLGRFVRLNSWDVFFSPRLVLHQLAESMLHPLSQPRAIGVSGMFAALLLVCYLTFTAYHQPNHEM